MKTAIVMGFAPFGDYPENPAGMLAEWADKKYVAGHHIKGLVLSPRPFYYVGNALKALIERHEPSVILAFGMSSSVRGLRVETVSRNWVDHPKYCEDWERNRLIDDKRPKDHEFAMDLHFLDFKIDGIPFEIEPSRDAGSFCCNALMYRMECLFEETIRVPFLFVHVPCTEKALLSKQGSESLARIEMSQLQKALLIMLGHYTDL